MAHGDRKHNPNHHRRDLSQVMAKVLQARGPAPPANTASGSPADTGPAAITVPVPATTTPDAATTRAAATTQDTTPAAASTTPPAVVTVTQTSSRTTPATTVAAPPTTSAAVATTVITSTSSVSRSSSSVVISSGSALSQKFASTSLSSLPSISAPLQSLGPSSSSAADSSSSSGPGAGTVVGIVAGALVGIVVLSGIVGYLFRAKWGNKEEDEDDKFDRLGGAFAGGRSRDDYRRDSVILSGEEDASEVGSGRGGMTELQNGAPLPPGLSRSGTYLPGLARGNTTRDPRPPSILARHVMHPSSSSAIPSLPPMPSFQPGQVVSSPYYQGMPPPRAISPQPPMGGGPGYGPHGGYGMPPPPGAFGAGPAYLGAPIPGMMMGGLERQNSAAGQYHALSRQPSAVSNYGAGGMHGQQQPLDNPFDNYLDGVTGAGAGSNHLSTLNEGSERDHGSRSGTPVNPNPQQTYFDDDDEPRYDLHQHGQGMPREVQGGAGGVGDDGDFGGMRDQGNMSVDREDRAKRTLSVRNGGLDDYLGDSAQRGNGNGQGLMAGGGHHGQQQNGGRPISSLTDIEDAYGGM